jgi:glycosyltransferase involved in cell wall biosynthesis
MFLKRIAFVVPCYNETLPLTKTLRSLLKYGEVVFINDGSTEFLNIDSKTHKKIFYLHHVANRGQGAALETGFEFIRQFMPDVSYIVTFDADGQHSLRDALRMVSKARQGYDVVLGSRFLGKTNEVSILKKIILQSFAKSYSFFSGHIITDRHFGLRVFSRLFIENNSLKTSNFEHADEILNLVTKNNWKYCEFSCTVSYTSYSKKKGQPIINGINILFDRAIKKL